jgi:hypothetical protein
VTERFQVAVRGGEGEAACAQLAPDTRVKLEDQAGEDCSDAITGLALATSPLTRVEVFVTNAKADLESGESVFLARGREGWRLSAVGCRPEGGKPADRPYDCVLEA